MGPAAGVVLRIFIGLLWLVRVSLPPVAMLGTLRLLILTKWSDEHPGLSLGIVALAFVGGAVLSFVLWEAVSRVLLPLVKRKKQARNGSRGRLLLHEVVD